MARKKQVPKDLDKEQLPITTEDLNIVLDHYSRASEDMDRRRLGSTNRVGWNDVLDAYHGRLPRDWPYLSEVTDPLIRTTILEKTARLFNNKLRGKVVPREGGDNIGSKIHNAILDFQWDNAQDGGTMLEKWAMMDAQTRLFGASFALNYWKYDKVEDDVIFIGNEMKVLDPRDVLIDPTATHVKNANWIQIREWPTLQDLEEENKCAVEAGGDPLYPSLEMLKLKIKDSKGGDGKSTVYESHIKDLRGLEEQTGQDEAFPTVEVVTEFRRDRWIKFAPQHQIILYNIENPRKDKQIPVTMLRYYPVPDDIYGEIEVEGVMPIANAVNSVLSGAIDEANVTMNPPIKVANADASVRMDTIVYGPNAIWQVGSSVNNVQEHQSSGFFVTNFQTMYTALKSAFNVAMGDTSMGVSNLDPTAQDKTATEVKALERQKISRDQYNQMYLEVALKDQMALWINNNKQFLFSDPTRQAYMLRIIGSEMIKAFKQMQLDEMTNDPEALLMVANMIEERNGDIDDAELTQVFELTQVPKYPVLEGEEIKPKLAMDDQDEYGSLTIVPEDLNGMYDFIPDVASMAIGADRELKGGRESALEVIKDQSINTMLQQQGYTLQAKDIVVSVLQDKGYKDAEKFIVATNESNNQINATGTGATTPVPGLGIPIPAQGMEQGTANIGGDSQQQIPQPQGQAVPIQPMG